MGLVGQLPRPGLGQRWLDFALAELGVQDAVWHHLRRRPPMLHLTKHFSLANSCSLQNIDDRDRGACAFLGEAPAANARSGTV